MAQDAVLQRQYRTVRVGIISKNDALEVLRPHLQDMGECVRAAWRKWKEEASAPYQKPDKQLRARAMHALIEDQVRMRMGAVPGVRIMHQQRFLLRVRDRLLLQFKKLDLEYRTRNFPTRTAIRFDQQEGLPHLGLMGHLPRLTLGYVLNELETSLQEIVVVCSRGGSVLWHEPLFQDRPIQQVFEPLTTPAAAPTGTARRVVVKAGVLAERGDGTN